MIGALLNMSDIYAEELSIRKGIIGNPLDVIRMGHPMLKQKAKEVADPTDPKIHQIVADMMATIDKLGSENIAGLAAPQVNIPLRILLFQVPDRKANGTEAILPFTVVINPKIEPISEEKELGWEGCISIPNLVGEVRRHKHIKYSYQTLNGETITREATDFHARVVQHETDHLDGTLYIERIENMKQLYFSEEFQEFVVKPAKEKQAKAAAQQKE